MSSFLNSAASLGALNRLALNTSRLNDTMQRLSSGLMVNQASDDPAAVVTLSHFDSAIANVQSKISTLTRASNKAAVAEGGAAEIGQALTELKETLAMAAGDDLTAEDKAAYQAVINSTVDGIRSMVAITTFAGQKLLDGTDEVDLSPESLGHDTLGYLDSLTSGGANSLSSGNVETAVAIVDAAIDQTATARGQLGAEQSTSNDAAIATLQSSLFNLSAARSSFADTDLGQAVSAMVSQSLLQQISLSMVDNSLQNTTRLQQLVMQVLR